MKYILSILLTAFALMGYTQSNVDLRGDSIRMFKQGGFTTFVLRNNTKDSTGGVLYNVGNGITRFQKSRMVSPTQLIIGGDTVSLTGGGSQGLQQVLDVSDVVDTFSLRTTDSVQWLFMTGDTLEFNNWRIFKGGGFLQMKSDTIISLSPSNQQTLALSYLRSTFQSPLTVARALPAQIAMFQAYDPNGEFDTGIYGEVSGGVQATKWAGTFFAVGGTNNYGVEGGALSGSGINASFRAAQPSTWAVNNWGFLGLSPATYNFDGPITTGALNGSRQASKYQFEDWGSMGLISDSIPTVSADDANLTMLVIDTLLASTGITQLLKVKLGINASASLNFADTTPGSSNDLTIAATGAVDGDPVVLGTPNASIVASGVFTAWVSSADVVTVRFTNTQTVGNLNPASGTFKVRVLK